jgi:hypothetical protein
MGFKSTDIINVIKETMVETSKAIGEARLDEYKAYIKQVITLVIKIDMAAR